MNLTMGKLVPGLKVSRTVLVRHEEAALELGELGVSTGELEREGVLGGVSILLGLGDDEGALRVNARQHRVLGARQRILTLGPHENRFWDDGLSLEEGGTGEALLRVVVVRVLCHGGERDRSVRTGLRLLFYLTEGA